MKFDVKLAKHIKLVLKITTIPRFRIWTRAELIIATEIKISTAEKLMTN